MLRAVPGSAPRRRRGAERGGGRARPRSRPGAARARAACAGRAGAATRRPERARRRCCGARSRAARAGAASRVVTTPARTSEWPARYLVALCQERSAPRSSGRCRSGVAKVESQHSSAPPACASLARPARCRSASAAGWTGVSMIASAAPSQARRKSLAIARVVAPDLDAEALEDLGREALEAVVAARRQGERLALAEHGQADARPGRHAAREDRRLGVLERAQQRLRLRRRQARGRVRRASCRRARFSNVVERSSAGESPRDALSASPRTSSESGSTARSISRTRVQGRKRAVNPRAARPAGACRPPAPGRGRLRDRARHRPGSRSATSRRIVATSR